MKFNNIYILCPGALKTGGPELLHQLNYQINKLSSSICSHVVYFKNVKSPVVKEFKKYLNSDWLLEKDIIDEPQNLIIFPETALSEFTNFHYAKKFIWWLSVDNYLCNNSLSFVCNEFGIRTALHYYINGTIRDRSKLIKMADLNLCQSYYAVDFLKKQGISNIKLLSDYLNDFYIENYKDFLKSNRKNIVLYNPKKGFKFTKKIIDASPDINWVPLVGMSNDQVLNYLKTSKVYIDFGNHPGKDRLPREAAICGCCIITGKKGAAAFKEDIPISETYKFDDKASSIPYIVKKIRLLLKNYDEIVKDFEPYRKQIINEKSQFIQECKTIFID